MLQTLRLSRETWGPEQVSPATSTDSAPVLVTATTKDDPPAPIPAKPRAVAPRFFSQSKYVVAVRASDGMVLSGGVAAMPAEVIELYCTGFGVSGGEPARVSIGGVGAEVQFAGRVGPGLYQMDVVVPAGLPTGDHPVIASTVDTTTQGEVLLHVGQAPDSANHPEGRYSLFVQKLNESSDSRLM